ncbi:MAG: hypothetical protein IH849_02070 [Acidobacteria bacterium]|nr:hypothetical protein [Acidobacteriota bacterium]
MSRKPPGIFPKGKPGIFSGGEGDGLGILGPIKRSKPKPKKRKKKKRGVEA